MRLERAFRTRVTGFRYSCGFCGDGPLAMVASCWVGRSRLVRRVSIWRATASRSGKVSGCFQIGVTARDGGQTFGFQVDWVDF